MGHTALREHYGGSVELELADDLTLGLPRGPGCVRLWRFWTSKEAALITLPTSDVHILPGGDPQYVIVNDGDLGIETFDVVAGAVPHQVFPGEAAVCTYSSAGWIVEVVTVELGSALTLGRAVFVVSLEKGNRDFNLRARLLELGWDGVAPVAALVTLEAGAWLGASTTSGVAFDTGVLPTGSTLLLRVQAGATLTGHGGDGGRGGDAGVGLLAQPGGAGGTGLRVRTGVATTIINSGTIQGGGGGGGGASSSGAVGGGGGGGGAGYLLARGGAGGAPTLASGSLGGVQVPGVGGGSGATQGGAGGTPGAAGVAAGAAGGAGGLAIDGIAYVTLLVPGTILGGTA